VEIDWSAHAFASVFAENWPGAQGGHAASFAVAEPAQPSPAGHVEIDWSAHAFASVFAENWPATQTGHAAFFVVPEALKPWPGGHVHVSEAQSVS
jgi:hypothetical protein